MEETMNPTSSARANRKFWAKCRRCGRKFRTLYSLQTHNITRHEDQPNLSDAEFVDDENKVVNDLPVPIQAESDSFKLLLSGLVEKINAAFHPRLPGKGFCPVEYKFMQCCFRTPEVVLQDSF